MRLARPVYESLPYAYMAMGGVAIFLFYLDPSGRRAAVAFAIGIVVEIAGLTLALHRQDYRSLSREYAGDQIIDLPSSL